ncbi:hypothetical protein, partial [Sphingomonas sp. S2M10]|uniref:hypothetical protein n=1 Tax=Sphingomonas sp. S2M10 TaxID=2705010 RepID=UPI0014577DA9
MVLPQPAGFDAFEERSALRAALPYLVGLALLIAAGWYLYTQMRWIGGEAVKTDQQTVTVVPLPPPIQRIC